MTEIDTRTKPKSKQAGIDYVDTNMTGVKKLVRDIPPFAMVIKHLNHFYSNILTRKRNRALCLQTIDLKR